MQAGSMRERRKRLAAGMEEDDEDGCSMSSDSLLHDHAEREKKPASIGDYKQVIIKRKRVELSVSGRRFVTYNTTLGRIPGSRLATLSHDVDEYDTETNSYFFDRNPYIFTFILSAYQSGELHFPHCLCSQTLKAELQYWRLPNDLLSACCWKKYCESEEEVEALAQLEDALIREKTVQQQRKANCKHTSRWTKFKARTYLFLEEPRSSRAAYAWSWFYVILLLTSVILMLLSTMDIGRIPNDRSQQLMANKTNQTLDREMLYFLTQEHPASKILSSMLANFFLVELIIRFIVWPRKRRFFHYLYNVIDVFAIIPLNVIYFINLVDRNFWIEHAFLPTFVITGAANVFRTLRILKAFKHNRDMRVMMLALKASARELSLLLLLMGLGMLLFSTGIYYAEFMANDQFGSIPKGFWWSLITMTTVGYGDMSPITNFGYFVGALCAVAGLLITALPIPIISNNFTLYYSFAKMDDNLAIRAENQLSKPETKVLTDSLREVRDKQAETANAHENHKH